MYIDPTEINLNATNRITKTYYSAGAQMVAMRVVTSTGGNTLYYLHTDHPSTSSRQALGSTSLSTCGSGGCGTAGALVPGSRQSYYPFGAVRTAASSLPTDITFTGQRKDASTGLMFYNARYYDPVVGRFVSADTIVPGAGNPQAWNRYSYVTNNPLNRTDPSGHCGEILIAFLGLFGASSMCEAPKTPLIWGDPPVKDQGSVVLSDPPLDSEPLILGDPPLRDQGSWILSDPMPDPISWILSDPPLDNQGPQIYAEDSCGAASFNPDTLVTTDDGLVPIGQLKPGDYVLAYNEATGETDYYPIEMVWIHLDPILVYLTIDGELIETTPEHPFYTETGEWVPAGELQIGKHVREADGELGTVQAVVFVPSPQVMYNLTVAQAHTFYVGEQQWLVHNGCKEPQLPNALKGGGKDTHVYQGILDGEPIYAGITNDMTRRQREHSDRFVLEELTSTPVTRGQARAIEQALITDNPQFENIQNSISPKHSWYQDAVTWGQWWLEQQGYKKE